MKTVTTNVTTIYYKKPFFVYTMFVMFLRKPFFETKNFTCHVVVMLSSFSEMFCFIALSSCLESCLVQILRHANSVGTTLYIQTFKMWPFERTDFALWLSEIYIYIIFFQSRTFNGKIAIRTDEIFVNLNGIEFFRIRSGRDVSSEQMRARKMSFDFHRFREKCRSLNFRTRFYFTVLISQNLNFSVQTLKTSMRA